MTPLQTFHKVIEDAALHGFLSSGPPLKPGQYYLEKVSEEDKAKLRDLKIEEIQETPSIIYLSGPQNDCEVCRFRFKDGFRQCTNDHTCPAWDHWSKPHPSRFRKRASIYSFSDVG